MAKLIINERQHKLIVSHIRENTLDANSKAIVDDILGSLNEGNMDGILSKVKDYAKKGLITASVLAALMAAPQLTSAQKSQINDIAKQKTQSSISVAPKGSVVSVNIMAEWNEYVKWLKTKGLSGDKKMNHVQFSKEKMEEFKAENKKFNLSYEHVIGVQKAIRRYRDYCIEMFNTKQANPQANTKSDMSNFMTWVTGTGDDGIAGEFTTQFMFPRTYLRDLNSGTITDQGFADPAIQK